VSHIMPCNSYVNHKAKQIMNIFVSFSTTPRVHDILLMDG